MSRALPPASAFGQLCKPNTLPSIRGGSQRQLVTDRLLADARGSCGFGNQFAARITPSRAVMWYNSRADDSLPLAEQMRLKIHEGLEAEFVDVVDHTGDARHISVKVVSSAFEGKNAINRQRLVYKCIWEEMQTDRVHAVQGIVTKTPAEEKSM